MCFKCVCLWRFGVEKMSPFSAHRKLMRVYLATKCKSVAMETFLLSGHTNLPIWQRCI